MSDVITSKSYDALAETGTDLAIGFFAGGAVFAAVMTPLAYFAVKGMVVRYRRKHG